MRYPRGLVLAFVKPGFGAPAESFLQPWRILMGPKMRTVCSVLSSPLVYGASTTEPLASAACLEAAYSTGLGYAEGFDARSAPDSETLIQGSVEAARSALKRLEGDGARLVLVIESSARHRALGSAAADEWAAIKSEVDSRIPRGSTSAASSIRSPSTSASLSRWRLYRRVPSTRALSIP